MQLGDALATVAIALTTAGLVYAGLQLRDAKRSARGQFLLALDERFERHAEVHYRLRVGGDWARASDSGPQEPAEWIAVEMYMGLFERVDLLVRDGLISLTAVDDLYGYRLLNLVANPVIRQEKLIRDADWWRLFIHLWSELSQIPNGFVASRYPCPPDIERLANHKTG
jgi:hypothetical protein